MSNFDNEGTEQPTTQQPKKGWFGRNWKWFVPVGCLGPLLVCGGCGGFFVFGIFSALKSSEAYTQSLAKAKASPQVIAALGDNIEPGMAIGGSVNLNNNNGTADVIYSISGSKGEAAVHCTGVKENGKWTFNVMDVTVVGTGEIIDLLE